MASSSQKERTPYRLPVRSRNKYLDSSDSRTELGLHNRNSFRTTKDHETGYRSRNKYDDQPSSSSRKPVDYYDGRSEKENVFKSKYDPDLLYSELNSDSSSKPTRRPIKAYRKSDNTSDRRHTTNFRLCPIDFEDTPSSSTSSSRLNSTRPTYTQRKSLGYQRSQTQQFFDAENNNFAEGTRERRLTERETKRKEIQDLIMKYAQADDNYPKTDEQKNLNNNYGEVGAKVENGITENGIPAVSKVRVRSRIPKAHSSIVRTFYFVYLIFFVRFFYLTETNFQLLFSCKVKQCFV